MLKLQQNVDNDFGYGGELRGFKILTTTSPVASNGIELTAFNNFLIDGLSMDGLSGTGITLIGDTDPDQNTLFEILRCHITNMGQRGINAAYVASNTLAMYRIAHNRIIGCNMAGMRLVFANAEVVNNGLALCGSTSEAQLIVHQPNATNYGMSTCRNFFEKGRSGELDIDACITGEVKLNTFTSNDASSGTYAVRMGSHPTGNTRNINLFGNRHIVHSTIASTYICYFFGDKTFNCALHNPEYNDISTAAEVSITETAKGQRNYIEDGVGRVLYSQPSKVTALTISATGTTALNLDNGLFQRLSIEAVGAHTIDAPFASEGQKLELMIQNNSGGTIAVTFGLRFAGIKNYFNPAVGSSTIATFRYDSVSAAWRQITPWLYITLFDLLWLKYLFNDRVLIFILPAISSLLVTRICSSLLTT